MSKPILYSADGSSCSSWVKIALALKKIDFEVKKVDFDSENELEAYYLCNPAKKVPTLQINGLTLTESLSIIEYLNEVYPEPPLLPKQPELRAHSRAIAFHIASNIQPLQGSLCREKLNTLSDGYGSQWCHDVLKNGFDALEQLLKLYSGKFCVGDQITIADVILPSIVHRAVNKYNVDMGPYPIISRIVDNLAEIPEFKKC